MSKYVFLKGGQGFADRLQVLLQTISYSKKTNRIIVVDWYDKIWAGNTNYDFYYYFTLSTSNVNWITYDEFKSKYIENKSKLSLIPNIWIKTNNLFQKNLDTSIYLKNTNFNMSFFREHVNEYKSFIQNEEITEILKDERQDFKEDIVVLNSSIMRSYKFCEFKNLFLKDTIKNKIASFEIVNKIKNIDYICVHLRGTDRRVSKKFNNNSNNYKEYTENIKNKLDNRIYKDIKNLVIISDSIVLIDEFEKLLEDDYTIYHSENILNKFYKNSKTGMHKLNENLLKKMSLTKNDVNLYTLLDFCILLNAKEIICDNHTFYSNTAKLLNYNTHHKLLDFKSI